MKKIIIIIFFAIPLFASSQNFQWVKNIRTSFAGNSQLETYGNQLVEDYQENIITVIQCDGYSFGFPNDTLDLDPGNGYFPYNYPLSNSPGEMIIQKLDKYGNFLWAFTISGSWIWLRKVQIDSNNNIYLDLDINGNADLDPGSGNVAASGECIVKYDASGSLIWYWTCPNNFSQISDISVDQSGNLYGFGIVDSIADLDPGIGVYHVIPNFVSTMVLFKWDYNQNLCWVKTFDNGQNGGEPRLHISVSKNDNSIALGGFYWIGFDFDPGLSIYTLPVYSSGNGVDIFISKVDTSGNFIWGNCIGSPSVNAELLNSISFDSQDNIILSGYFGDSINFDPINSNSFSYSNGGYDFFVAKFNSNGVLTWGKTFGNAYNDMELSSVVTSNDNIYNAANFNGTIDVDPGQGILNLVSGAQKSIFIQKLDSSGSFVAAGKIDSISLLSFQGISARGNISSANNNLFLTGQMKGTTDFDPWQGNMTDTSYKSHSFTLKLADQFNSISGTCYNDINNNGILDVGELPMKYVPVKLLPYGNFSISDSTGKYYFETDTGSFLLSTSANYYNINPAQHNVSLSTYYNSDTTNDFGLHATANINDLEISITNVGPARRGFDVQILINYKNSGTTILSPDISFVIDPNLTFVNSNPVQNNMSGDTLFYSFSNVQPQQTGTVLITLHVPGNVPLNTSLFFTSVISPYVNDATPGNNTSNIRPNVIGSFDPNEKQVEPSDYTWQQFQIGDYLYYTIRFQNIGSDTAFHIHIIDTLNSKLDPSTFEFIGSSHPCVPYMSGSGIMDFQFYNIQLPDSNINELQSHGFVKYKIKPKPYLQLNDLISNTAYIYFDFNSAVVTNTVTNSVGTALYDQPSDELAISAFPNPFDNLLWIQLHHQTIPTTKVFVYEITGRKVFEREFQSPLFNLDLSSVVKGLYIVELQNGQQAIRIKAIKN